MSASQPAVVIDGVGKSFRRSKGKATSLKSLLLRRGQGGADDFWALKEVSHTIQPGSTVGLIGPNGSGKTTLLKIIAGILRPSEGSVTTRGRIAALLELGAGFHQELTGRDNVYLNASILGLTRKETDKVFDDIVAFSEIEDFIDTPVKFYSSGMFVRLGFAVAVHVDPEILLVDEVLAVGDEGFQRKCMDKITAFQHDGRTIVFVTHVVDQVRKICSEALMLQQGQVVISGTAEEAVKEYRKLLLAKDVALATATPTHELEIASLEVVPAPGRTTATVEPGDDLTIQVDLKTNAAVTDPVVAVTLHDQHGTLMYTESTSSLERPLGAIDGRRRLLFTLRHLPYTSGKYYVTVGATSADGATLYDLQEQRATFEIPATTERPPVAFIPTDLDVEDL